MKPSVLHRHEMLNEAYVDDKDIIVASSPIPEKTEDAEFTSENEDNTGMCLFQVVHTNHDRQLVKFMIIKVSTLLFRKYI